MSIRVLSKDVQKILSASLNIPTFNVIIRNLLTNSLDSNSTEITLTLDTNNFDIITIQDNGNGIMPECISQIGLQNHYTDKLASHVHTETANLDTFGFKGSFLYSLNSCCQSIDILSKRKGYNSTWNFNTSTGHRGNSSSSSSSGGKANMCSGDPLKITENIPFAIFPTHGTLIKINKVYGKFAVRLKMLKNSPKNIILQDIKQTIFDVIVIYRARHSDVNIKVNVDFVNGSTKNLTYHFNSDKCTIVDTFQKIFPNLIKPTKFKNISTTYKQITIQGFISSVGIPTQSYQNIYLENWNFEKNPLIQKWLKNINRKFENYINFDSNKFETKSVGNPYKSYPIMTLLISCPMKLSDICCQIEVQNECILSHTDLTIIVEILDKIVSSFLSHLSSASGIAITPGNDKIERKSPLYAKTFSNNSINMVLNSKMKCARVDLHQVEGLISNKKNMTRNESTVKPTKKRLKYDLDDKMIIQNKKNLTEKDKLASSSACTLMYDLHNHDVQLQKSDLQKTQIIKQVDSKFILLKISDPETLCILDQHACDERIKLEKMLYTFFSQTIPTVNLSCGNDVVFSKINEFEISLFEKYHTDFLRVGIEYTLIHGNALKIKTVPVILYEKIKKSYNASIDYEFLKNGLLKHIYDLNAGLKRRFSASFIENKSLHSAKWWLQVQSAPTVILEIMNSKACRSAIMFGEELSRLQCQSLIANLSQCNMPFHCAHGRPSILPLFAFNQTVENDIYPTNSTFTNDYSL